MRIDGDVTIESESVKDGKRVLLKYCEYKESI